MVCRNIRAAVLGRTIAYSRQLCMRQNGPSYITMYSGQRGYILRNYEVHTAVSKKQRQGEKPLVSFIPYNVMYVFRIAT